MRLLVLGPHFAPDTAPTGAVLTRLVGELAARGHEAHVVTSLPWYRQHRVEDGWRGRWMRRERAVFGSVTRVHPFPASDRRDIARRAVGFAAFCALAGVGALTAGGRRRFDAVVVMSPPLPLGVVGWAVSLLRGGRVLLNVQDVFPDAAVATGAITDARVIRLAAALERFTYRRAATVTVLSEDLAANVRAKVPERLRDRVEVVPNFCDTDAITPLDRMTRYRAELGIGGEPVVMYAGNVGLSQSLTLLLDAARALPGVTFVINGDGTARPDLERRAAGLANVRFGDYQPDDRLPEVLATADLHVVALRRGLGQVSVPSKTYSILAAGRPVLAAIDPGTEVTRLLDASGAGLAVVPDDPGAFVAAVARLVADPERLRAMGGAGRRWAERHVAPAAVGARYAELLEGQGGDARRGSAADSLPPSYG